MYNTPVTESRADEPDEADATAMPDDGVELNLNTPGPVLKLQPCEGTGLGQDGQVHAAGSLATDLTASFEVPTWPLNNLFPSIDIIESLRKQSEVKDLPSFQRSLGDFQFAAGLDPSSDLGSEFQSKFGFPTPYFIPELEMLCADWAQDKLTNGFEITSASAIEAPKATAVEESNLPGIEDSTPHKSEEECISGIQETNPPQIEIEEMESPKVEAINSSKCEDVTLTIVEEINLPKLEEYNLPEIEEINLTKIEEINQPKIEDNISFKPEEIDLPQIEEKDLSTIYESTVAEILPPISPHVHEPEPVLLPAMLPEKRILISHPLPPQNSEICAVVIEKSKPPPRMGFIRSFIGSNLLWKPSIRLSFGDRRTGKLNNSDSKEAIKQDTCVALKALILSIKLSKKIETSMLGM